MLRRCPLLTAHGLLLPAAVMQKAPVWQTAASSLSPELSAVTISLHCKHLFTVFAADITAPFFRLIFIDLTKHFAPHDCTPMLCPPCLCKCRLTLYCVPFVSAEAYKLFTIIFLRIIHNVWHRLCIAGVSTHSSFSGRDDHKKGQTRRHVPGSYNRFRQIPEQRHLFDCFRIFQ